MKKVFLALTMLISSAAFAGKYSPETPWEVLMKDYSLKIDAPVVFMGHAIDYTFVCVDGDLLRTKKKLEQRRTIYIGKDQIKEVVIGHKYLYTPIKYTRTISDCKYVGDQQAICKDKVVSGVYPLTANITVSKYTSPNQDRYNFLFKKPWTLPSCR